MSIKEKLAGLIDTQIREASDEATSSVLDKISQDLERLVEEAGIDKEYRVSLNGYIYELTNDIIAMRNARFWAAVLLVVVVFLTMLMFGYLVLCPQGHVAFNAIEDEHAKLAVIIGSFALVFGLTALLVKGVFNSQKQEDASVLIPEHIKLILEAARGVSSK
jgi:hypothetical protein